MAIPQEVSQFLTAYPVFYLASIRDGKPKNRPFGAFKVLENKLWFCTNKQKEVYKDLTEKPDFEIAVTGENMKWLRLWGKAVFEENRAVKEAFLDGSLKDIYGSADNPIFAVFYVKDATAIFYEPKKEETVFKW